MAALSPTPTFFGQAVVVTYHPTVRTPEAVHDQICKAIRRIEAGHGTAVEMLQAITDIAAKHGYTARLTRSNPEVIGISVTRQ